MQKISEVVKSILEARRNPELNIKPSPGETAARAKAEFGEDRVIGVTMTHLEKVGINPRSDYNTPIGIYAYPYEWMMSKVNSTNTDWGGKRISSVLPFESKAPFMTFFSLKPSANVLFLKEATKSDQDEVRRNLIEILVRFGGLEETRADEFFKGYVDDEVNMGNSYVDPSYPGNVIWYMSYKVAEKLISSKSKKAFDFDALWDMPYDIGQAFLNSYEYTSAGNDQQIQMLWNRVIGFKKDINEIRRLSDNQKSQLKEKLIKKIIKSIEQRTKWARSGTSTGMTVIWNKVLRELGYDAVVDNGGTGVIHEAEPFQMVILNPKVIDKVIRVKNEPEPSGINSDAKEKVILDKLEDGTLNVPIVASILNLPKEQANAESILSGADYKKYSKIAPFRNALEKYLYNTLYYGESKKILDHKLSKLEKSFGKYSLSNFMVRVMNDMNDTRLSWAFDRPEGPGLVMTIIKYIKPEDISKTKIQNLIMVWNRIPHHSDPIYSKASVEMHKAYTQNTNFKNWVNGLGESDKPVRDAIQGMIDLYNQFAKKKTA